MERMQGVSDKTFSFGKMEYKARKVVWISGEVGGRKVKIRTKVVEGKVSWIISWDWMKEWGEGGVLIDEENWSIGYRG